MTENIKWSVILVCPGEDELSLLAELTSRQDTTVVAIADPDGTSVGVELAEIMGIPVVKKLDAELAKKAQYLVYPAINDQIADIIDDAKALGMESSPAKDFLYLQNDKPQAGPRSKRTLPANGEFDFLETETANIHRSLSRVEEAMDREALLRWLLGLATRASGATSGSVMLYDTTTEELYLGFAYGLSEATQHRTRVRLGDDIAGRVAASGQAELIAGNQHPGGRRDRQSVHEAICAPIKWENSLLGVLNVSNNQGDGRLAPNALELVKSLTHRFGMILDRFLNLQAIRDGEEFRDLEETLTRDAGAPEQAGTTLCMWAEDLADAAGADYVSLDVLTGDGDLFSADRESVRYLSPLPQDKAQVLSTGRPVVVRPDGRNTTDDDPGCTVFLLPVGHDQVRALLCVEFEHSSKAHHFNSISRELLFLVNRHLAAFLDRVGAADQIDRLTMFSTVLAELAGLPDKHEADVLERILNAARQVTGATTAYVLQQDDVNNAYDLQDEAKGLLEKTGNRTWLATTLPSEQDGRNDRRSLLVAPIFLGQPYPGLVLLDKNRLHPFDGQVFNEFDAVFANRLLPLLGKIIGVTLDGAMDMLGNLEPVADDPVHADPEPMPEPDPKSEIPPHEHPGRELELMQILRREMDRCDRYHIMMGLTAFQLAPMPDRDAEIPALVQDLDKKLRSSDYAIALDRDTILVVVPEDVQSLSKQKKRVKNLIRELVGHPDLQIAAVDRVYPGGGDTPIQLLTNLMRLFE